MAEPTITESVNEGIARFDFADNTDFIFDANYVEFVGGKIKLVDLGGGTYNPGSNYVVTPPIIPDRVKLWVRIIHEISVPAGCIVLVELQFSNDGGNRWGISEPDFNDGGWCYFTPGMFNNYNPNENGRDQIKFRLILVSDGASTPEVDWLEVTYFIHAEAQIPVPYVPVFTTSQIISDLSMGTVKPIQIYDTNIRYAEIWVKSELRRLGIDWSDLTSDSLIKDNMEKAASYRTLCITGQFGVGNGVVGPIASISGDGISKTFSRVSGIYKGAEGSPEDFCVMARESMDTVVDMYRAGEDTAKTIFPGFSRDNELLDQSGFDSGYDHRRRYYDE